jgi:hypothetical protein
MLAKPEWYESDIGHFSWMPLGKWAIEPRQDAAAPPSTLRR